MVVSRLSVNKQIIQISIFLFHIHFHAFTMRGEFRGIHTLNGGNSVAEISSVSYKHRIFKNISSFIQIAKEILTSEESYVKGLYILTKIYLAELKKVPGDVLPPDTLKVRFYWNLFDLEANFAD